MNRESWRAGVVPEDAPVLARVKDPEDKGWRYVKDGEEMPEPEPEAIWV